MKSVTHFSSLLLSASLFVGFVGMASSLVACAPRSITPAEIDHNGTKTFYGRDAGSVGRASVAALRTLGFDVVVTDMVAGKIKTAPKVVAVHAVGNQYAATALQDSLAWTVELVRASDGTVVRLHPRFFRNGQPIDNSQIAAAPMNRAFVDLFREIDENLPGGSASTSTTSAPVVPAAKTNNASKATTKANKYAKTAQ